MTITVLREAGVSAPTDPDETIHVCHDCGGLFVGQVDWQSICLHCWRRSRDELVAGCAGERR
jgi:hypothetical protein